MEETPENSRNKEIVITRYIPTLKTSTATCRRRRFSTYLPKCLGKYHRFQQPPLKVSKRRPQSSLLSLATISTRYLLNSGIRIIFTSYDPTHSEAYIYGSPDKKEEKKRLRTYTKVGSGFLVYLNYRQTSVPSRIQKMPQEFVSPPINKSSPNPCSISSTACISLTNLDYLTDCLSISNYPSSDPKETE